MTTAPARLFFLDWVRILAFFLLIVFHTGMYYVTWDWHVKSPFASDAIEPFMMLSSPWRLGLLFMVSGVASSFMLTRMSAASFLRMRSGRLLMPLLFGMLVIVPPQSYCEVIEKLAYAGSYADFMKLYLSGYHGFCRGSDCLILPTWNHLWFLPYLWLYTMVLGMATLILGARMDKLAARVAQLLTGWRIIAVPAAILAALRLLLADRFHTTHAFIDDWYEHAAFLFLFLLGAMLARQRSFWPRLDSVRWSALGIALSCWAALTVFYHLPAPFWALPEMGLWRLLMQAVYSLCSWSAIVAVCAFAQRHLNHDSAQRRYLTEAVFPVYILHQTLIVTIAHLIKPARLAPAPEALVLIVLTTCLSFGGFELVRRFSPLRPWFGLARARPLNAPQASGTVVPT